MGGSKANKMRPTADSMHLLPPIFAPEQVMFTVVKTWDNRKETKEKRLPTISGRTWTRRVQWLRDGDQIKLKFDTPEGYWEHLVLEPFAQMVWDRFKAGASVEDAVSIMGSTPPKPLQSRRCSQ